MAQRLATLLQTEPGAVAKALGPASWDWQERAHKLVWKFKRVQGGTDHTLKVSWSTLQHAQPCFSLLQQQCTLTQVSVRMCHDSVSCESACAICGVTRPCCEMFDF